jgi:hypothetical protein
MQTHHIPRHVLGTERRELAIVAVASRVDLSAHRASKNEIPACFYGNCIHLIYGLMPRNGAVV